MSIFFHACDHIIFRSETLLKRLMKCTPSLSESERIMHGELSEMSEKLQQTKLTIQQVKG